MAERQAVARLLQPTWARLGAARPLFTATTMRQFAALKSGSRSTPTGTSQRRSNASSTSLGVQQSRSFSVHTPARAKAPRQQRTIRNQRRSENAALPMSLDNMSILVPMTFVEPPVWRWPTAPGEFLHMGWLAGKNRFMNYLYLVLHKIYSKPSFLGKAKLQLRRGAIVPAARDLHARFNAAIAAGDKAELRRVCTQELYEKMAGVVDARPRGQRVLRWAVERYEAPWYYPRLTDDKIAQMPMTPTESRVIRQAVVSIASTQRIARIDEARGVEVPGSAKSRKVLEHIVLTSYLDQQTWEQTPWRIWGTLPESSVKGHLEEVEAYELLNKKQQGL
jgi:mitochondrial protein MBA1